MKYNRTPFVFRITCLTAFLLAVSPVVHAFDGTLDGCRIRRQVDGTVGQVGVSNFLSSLSGTPSANTTFRLRITDRDGVDFHIGTPVVTKDGTPVTMVDSSEGVFYITDTVEGYNRTPMTPAGLFFSRGRSEIQVEYTGEVSGSAAVEAGAYTVTGVTSCVRR